MRTEMVGGQMEYVNPNRAVSATPAVCVAQVCQPIRR